mmetsp:Transcript_32507/g.74276  ORF Transcript_32507/g.74276 Transcript_32507/m.74276 type:complete len:399 (+) Transcript_32507:103-1299(+)
MASAAHQAHRSMLTPAPPAATLSLSSNAFVAKAPAEVVSTHVQDFGRMPSRFYMEASGRHAAPIMAACAAGTMTPYAFRVDPASVPILYTTPSPATSARAKVMTSAPPRVTPTYVQRRATKDSQIRERSGSPPPVRSLPAATARGQMVSAPLVVRQESCSLRHPPVQTSTWTSTAGHASYVKALPAATTSRSTPVSMVASSRGPPAATPAVPYAAQPCTSVSPPLCVAPPSPLCAAPPWAFENRATVGHNAVYATAPAPFAHAQPAGPNGGVSLLVHMVESTPRLPSMVPPVIGGCATPAVPMMWTPPPVLMQGGAAPIHGYMSPPLPSRPVLPSEVKLREWLATIPSSNYDNRHWDDAQITNMARFAEEQAAGDLPAEEIYRRYVQHQVELADNSSL